MTWPALRVRNFFQFCWVTPDLEASIEHWVRSAGAGPFFLFESTSFTESHYRGTPADLAPNRAAIGQLGDIQIELVSPTTDERSIWTDVVPPGRSGFHHAAIYCTDQQYEAERAAWIAAGAEVAFEGLMKGARTCYIDAVETLGFMIQLVTANPVADYVFGRIREAARNWRGENPIRTL